MSATHQIRYENTLDDLVAFTLNHLEKSPHQRRVKRIATWTLPVLVLGACVVVDLMQLGVEWTPWAVIFGFFYVVIYRRSYARSLRRSARALYQEGKNASVLCEHVLEVMPEGLVERTPVGESRAAWSTVERVETTPKHILIYVQATNAHVIPREQVPERDLEVFVAAVREAVEAAAYRTGPDPIR